MIEQNEYDRLVKELGFDMRAKAGERTETDEERARKERDRLEELEVCYCRSLYFLFYSCFGQFSFASFTFVNFLTLSLYVFHIFPPLFLCCSLYACVLLIFQAYET